MTIVEAPNLLLSGCYFEGVPQSTRANQYLHLNAAASAVIDGCYFNGGPNASLQPLFAMRLENGFSMRVSNNAVWQIANGIASVASSCTEFVEFGNHEINGVPRFLFGAQTSAKQARGNLMSVLRYALTTELPQPSDVPKGTLVWIDDASPNNLQINSGSQWTAIVLA